MKFDDIELKLRDTLNNRFVFKDNSDFEVELLDLADEDLKYKKIIRIKRHRVRVDNYKTIVIVQIEASSETDIKIELKKVIRWVALIKEALLGAESADLYLFLAFNNEVSVEECLRIESTEQFCRKYVLLPNENIDEFVNRTFLQNFIDIKDIVDAEDPLERAFTETETKHNWLNPELKKNWKDAFLKLSGVELANVLLELEDLE